MIKDRRIVKREELELDQGYRGIGLITIRRTRSTSILVDSFKKILFWPATLKEWRINHTIYNKGEQTHLWVTLGVRMRHYSLRMWRFEITWK